MTDKRNTTGKIGVSPLSNRDRSREKRKAFIRRVPCGLKADAFEGATLEGPGAHLRGFHPWQSPPKVCRHTARLDVCPVVGRKKNLQMLYTVKCRGAQPQSVRTNS